MTSIRSTHLLFTVALAVAGPSVWAQTTAAASVETLSNGVKIQHITVGTGPQPSYKDTVKVHYRGTLADGKEFDSSYKRNAPATFPLSRVIPCWTEGVARLRVGGKAVLTCPPASAYGERGAPGAVPPNATLTFEVELLGIGG
ncbi:FKBP-type peptidyl-prolyl cis-trans isomerase [Hydrogenophaga soli]|nr:FKBP-type peptidyl-prolyl cis-trans isomerase [Burkholderiaceae bacterium]